MEKEEERRVILIPYVGMAVFILATQLFALKLATPFEIHDIKAFQDPESLANPFLFFILILLFTAFVLVLLRYKKEKLVYLVMIAGVAVTVYYVMSVLIPYDHAPLVITLLLTFFLYKYPEWYVIDAVGVMIAAGVTAIFGISLSIIPIFVLLTILAAYDAIAVYRTKHMISLAEAVIDLRMPVLFVLPKARRFSLLRKTNIKEGLYMGLGDAIIPSMLVVSANRRVGGSPNVAFFPSISVNMVALCVMVGIFFGYAMLCVLVSRGKAQAGLPFLNSFAMLGFLIGYFLF
ncbi:MAG: presenilin family intramembrane aspartyl protease PSH [Candidatus Methanospirareceae archaeon]